MQAAVGNQTLDLRNNFLVDAGPPDRGQLFRDRSSRSGNGSSLGSNGLVVRPLSLCHTTPKVSRILRNGRTDFEKAPSAQRPGFLPARRQGEIGNLRIEDPHPVVQRFMLQQPHQVLKERGRRCAPIDGPRALVRGQRAERVEKVTVQVPHVRLEVFLRLLQPPVPGLCVEFHASTADGVDVARLNVGSVTHLPNQRPELGVRRKVHDRIGQHPQQVICQPACLFPRFRPLDEFGCGQVGAHWIGRGWALRFDAAGEFRRVGGGDI